jgi:hypothetical protein
MRRAPSPGTLAFGLVLVALGVLGTLANLGRVDLLATLRTWWPLTLVAWGVLELADALLRQRDAAPSAGAVSTDDTGSDR